jgi:hypothetical protein
MKVKTYSFLLFFFWETFSLHGQSFVEQYEAYMVKSQSNATPKLAESYPGAPGHGYPGKIQPYTDSSELAVHLAKYNLTASWFVREPIGTNLTESTALRYYTESENEPYPDRIAFLHYAPEAQGSRIQKAPMPLLVYISGCGEVGEDLITQFRHQTLFSIVTSKAFQKKYPCYFLVPSPPKCEGTLMGGMHHRPSLVQNLLNDTILAFMREMKDPLVDTNRLYATGLSYGGGGVYYLGMRFPGQFAALAPVAVGTVNENLIHPLKPGNWWHFYNEGDYAKHGVSVERLRSFQSRVIERGGEFRIGTYPDQGHNAWEKAWKEDAVWEWMFSKSLLKQEVGGQVPEARKLSDLSGKTKPSVLSSVPVPTCSASVPGRDDGTGPERGADGLKATFYLSERPVSKGDWWQAEYAAPVTGNGTLTLGQLKSKDIHSKGRIETSYNGTVWSSVVSFSKSESVTFRISGKVRFVRVVSTTTVPELLAVKELIID